jgi:hypothetical protein
MTRILRQKLLIGYLVFSIGAIGFLSFANAEQFEESECIRTSNIEKDTVDCFREIAKEFNASAFQDNSDDPLALAVLDAIYEARENGQYIEPCRYDPVSSPCDGSDKKKKTSFDWHIENICESDRPSNVETCRIYGEKIDALNEGLVGIGKLEPIQEQRSFILPLEPLDKTKSFKLANVNYLLVRASLAVEECIAKQTEHDIILSAQYEGYLPQDEDFQAYHASIASDKIIIPSDKLTQFDFENSLTDAFDVICESNYYSNNYKKDAGCKLNYDGAFENPFEPTNEINAENNKVLKELLDWSSDPSYTYEKEEGRIVEEVFSFEKVQRMSEEGLE